jgi:2-polyprenyl-3-methyl-5-hydroxy-6-metoxy-1,4-benzoquinol methylase
MKRYFFEEVAKCEMCGDSTDKHRVLGQRLNRSQGFSPRSKTGISVSIKKCSKCDLIYSSPQPIPFNIQDHYGIPPENYWSTGYFEIEPGYFLQQINEAKELLPFENGMTALDVGAGLGKCMIALGEAGFDAFGFEPSVPFYERAISKMHVNSDRLKLGMIEDVDYPENTFDFITFGAVFEHLYHPAACLEKALTWLAPGGLIHIEVPSSKHLIAKIIDTYFRIRGTNYVTHLSPMHSPFHLYEFGLKSFQELGRRLNYSVIKHHYDVCTIDFVPGFLHPIFRKYMQWTNSGKQLTVFLKAGT